MDTSCSFTSVVGLMLSLTAFALPPASLSCPEEGGLIVSPVHALQD